MPWECHRLFTAAIRITFANRSDYLAGSGENGRPIGVGTTLWFVHLGFIHRDDKVWQFVCMWICFILHLPLAALLAVIFYLLH
jgi:hypothetical protein